MVTLSAFTKAILSLVMSVVLIVVQALNGVYTSGGSVSALTWLGIVATLVGPAGLVYLVNNNGYFGPAIKAAVQQVCAVALVVIQGVVGAYSGGISTAEWLGIGATLLSSLVVYFAPNAGLVNGSVPARA